MQVLEPFGGSGASEERKTPERNAAGPLFARFRLLIGQKEAQQLENGRSDHANPKGRLPGPFLKKLGR